LGVAAAQGHAQNTCRTSTVAANPDLLSVPRCIFRPKPVNVLNKPSPRLFPVTMFGKYLGFDGTFTDPKLLAGWLKEYDNA
jgi:hypothetical protein